jgi:nitrous oxidase accessory protein NosD
MRKSAALLLILVLLTASCIIMFSPVQAEPRTIVVPDDYATITSAIANANDGDTVFVRKGTYAESTLNISKSVALKGENASNTVISNIDNPPWDYSFPPPSPTVAIQINADNVKVSDFTISGATISIAGKGDGTMITDNIISEGYIALEGLKQTVAENQMTESVKCNGSQNNISANNIVGNSGGIILEGSFNVVYANIIKDSQIRSIDVNGDGNTIANNSFTKSSGIWIEKGSNNIVYANSGASLVLREGFNNTFSANYVANTPYGAIIGADRKSATGQLLSSNNIIFHNNFVNNTHQVRNDYTIYSVDVWDNGSEGNYWSDYHGKDADGDGIGDTPYVIDDNRSDRYPLMAPFDISSVTVELPEWASNLPFETQELNPPEPFPTMLVIASVITVVVIGAGLLVYFRKRKH